MANRRRKKRVNYGSGVGEQLSDMVNSSAENQGEMGIMDVNLDQSHDSVGLSFASDEDSSFSISMSLNDSMPEDMLDLENTETEEGLFMNNTNSDRAVGLSNTGLINDDERIIETKADREYYNDVDNGFECLYHSALDKVSELNKAGLLTNLILLTFLSLPSLWILWNSLESIDKFIPAFCNFTLQSVCVVVLAITFVLICTIYVSRQIPGRWTVFKINDSLTYDGNDDQSIENFNKGVQTKVRGDGLAKIYLEIDNCETQLKGVRRQFLKLKRSYAQKLAKLKVKSKEQSEFLSRLQLQFPDLERERDLLIAEKEAIEKQHEEEKRRNRELIGRFQRLQQQLGRNGQRQMVNPY
ncbi:hypothetical protein LOTGIDRAFT_234369 [Lottia gigantea]|uniref:Uncharacterized protein n=1 Tax=Lottia gigantea TaxID=225164 RepID=V3ZWI6_LOTGI|nr:hypothetical protein LOTGIDRAFT_234369 [Lottia gigantea]ESO88757.1 hypothetical protein LOTGIDRAFT_234369 [Lottia gigantea]